MKKLGLIVNPVAGMGGRVGLKGTDGPDILSRAVELGAVPRAHERTAEALRRVSTSGSTFSIYTCSGDMGEKSCLNAEIKPEIVYTQSRQDSSSEDTTTACKELIKIGIDMLVFAGGDGTARDVFNAVSGKVTVIGIPAGVKIHSAVFASSPAKAGMLISEYLTGNIKSFREAEVIDLDEESYRDGMVKTSLYGYLNIPYKREHIQGMKSASPASEKFYQQAIAADIVDNMDEDFIYIIGPGTTTKAIMDRLGIENTLLGVDVVCQKKIITLDAYEKQILNQTAGSKYKIIVTPIGGQGYLFGRGNQQISPEILHETGIENVIIVSTNEKINSLQGKPLLVDTGDPKLDKKMCGYYPVITGYRDRLVYKVSD